MKRVKLTVASLALSCVCASSLFAATAADPMQQMQQQMQKMQQRLESQDAQIAQLRAQNDQNWLNEKRAAEVKNLVKEVLADADTRASLLESSMTGGHNGKNFFLASEDGSFSLNLNGVIQMRYVANTINGSSDEDEDVQGFDMRRLELSFSGQVVSPKMKYYIQFASNRDGNATSLQGAYISYKLNDKMEVTGGRIKAPLLREEIVSSNMQLCMERSLVNAVFTGAYAEGIQLAYTTDQMKLSAMINDGLNSGTSASDDYDIADVDYAVTGRVDYIVKGKWSQFKDFNAWDGEDLGLLLGAAVHYQAGESGVNGTGQNDGTLEWTVDGYFENKGLSVYSAFIGRHITDGDAATSGDSEDYGFLAQAGYFVIPNKLQPYVRYEWLRMDESNAVNELGLITVGANYYFNKDRCRFSLDMIYAMDPVVAGNTDGVSMSGIGLVNDAAGEDGQMAFRAEFQLKF